MPPTLPAPATEIQQREERVPLFNVVLLNDDDHTYDYVIEMLGAIFLHPAHVAFHHAVEVDTTGRTIVMTCERAQAEFGVAAGAGRWLTLLSGLRKPSSGKDAA